MRGRQFSRGIACVAIGAALCVAAQLPCPVTAQPRKGAKTDPPEDQAENTIVVTARRRGSAIGDIAPVAELGEDALAAIGATSIDELRQAIRGQTQSADGSEPIFLLNAQRVSSYQEIGSLPPEAIAKVEVLPEQAALRYGFPPTRRVVNFITKNPFDQTEAKLSAGTSVPTGSATESARAGYTYLRGSTRLTANLEYSHTDPLLRSERDIAPDPGVPFDPQGNVTGRGGGEIDHALSALAGRIVTIAPVPQMPSERGRLGAYAAAANRPRLYVPGADQSLTPGTETVKGEAVLGDLVGETMSGSLTLSVEHTRSRALGGPAPAPLILPATNPFSPFAVPVELDRYLTEVAPLKNHDSTTTIDGGATLRGAIAGWQWDATASLAQTTAIGRDERGIDLARANAAIAAGANPFAPLDPALLADRLTDRTYQRTRTIGTKLVASGSPFDLPAGRATATATLETERATSRSQLMGADPFALDLGRSRFEGGVALDLPIASRDADVLRVVGDLSFNASANLRHIGGFGTLHDDTLGLVWSPIEGVQLLASAQASAAAPDLAQQATPPRRIDNVPVFDFATGRTQIVTLMTGGNPDLLAERRSVHSLSLTVQPIANSQLRINLAYTDTGIRNQTGTIAANAPETEAQVPDLFTRDAAGDLISVSYRPINFYDERKRGLQLSITASGRVGAPPPKPGDGAPPPQDDRPRYYSGLVPILALTDRLRLRPGTPALDLLRGDSIGTYTPRFSGYGYAGLNRDGYGTEVSFYFDQARRIRSSVPTSDLRFAAVFQLNVAAYVPLGRLFPHADWAKKLQLRLDTQNLLNSRQRVVDGTGATPFRYQTDLIDPIQRTVTLSLRKRF